MARTVTNPTEQAIFGAETSEVFIVLLEIDHTDLGSPIRVCSDSQDVTSNGDVYSAYPFLISLPIDDSEQDPVMSIRIDNVDRTIIISLRGLTSPPSFQVQVIRLAAPNTIEVEFKDFTLKQIQYNANEITGTITLESFLFEPYPAGKMTPNDFPGLF